MKKILLAVLLVLALSTPAMALLLPLGVSNTQGGGQIYGNLQFTQVDGNTVAVSANYNSSIFLGTPGVKALYLNLPSAYMAANTLTFDSAFWTNFDQDTTPPPSLSGDGFGKFNISGQGGTIPIATIASGNFTELFTISSSSNFSVYDFLIFPSDKGSLAAMHLAEYTPYTLNGKEVSSEWLGTPIPGTMYLFGSGLAGLVGIARWRRRK